MCYNNLTKQVFRMEINMKIKKFLCIILAAVMLTGTVSVTAFASDAPVYSDVAEDMWSYPDIMYVSENGLMNGTGGTTFSPLVNVTRAMVVTVLYRMEGSPDAPFLKTAYADVADGRVRDFPKRRGRERKYISLAGLTNCQMYSVLSTYRKLPCIRFSKL